MKQKVLLLMVLALGMCNINVNAQDRELMTEGNGFKWYMIKTEHENWLNWSGAADYNGRTIIPVGRYDAVMYLCIDGVGSFYVHKIINDEIYEGVCDYTGREIIPCKYDNVVFYKKEKYFKCTDKAGKEYIIPADYDEKGNIIMPSKSYSSNNIGSSRTSASHNSGASEKSKSSPDLRYKGIYTMSSQGRSQTTGGYTGVAGPDFETEIEIYDDYIIVGSTKCTFDKVSGGERVYSDSGWGFSGTHTHSTYYVDSNYNIRRVDTFSSQFGTDWFEYAMAKGRCTMPKYQPQFSGSSSSSGGGSTYGSGGSTSNQKQTGKKSRTACRSCMYTNGKCSVCKGTGRQRTSAAGYSTTTQCRNCGGSGRCPTCGGDGWIN